MAEGILAAALAASDERAARVLAGEPWLDPRTRSAALIAGDMHQDRMNAARATDLRAQAARAEADAARRRVGFLDRLAAKLGVRTVAVRDLDEAEHRAARAEAAQDTRSELRAELTRLDGQARGVARAREAERLAWTWRPEVVAARREMDGNGMVRVAVAAGDFRIGHLAAIDLPAAWREMFWREGEKVQRAEEIRPRHTAPQAPSSLDPPTSWSRTR